MPSAVKGTANLLFVAVFVAGVLRVDAGEFTGCYDDCCFAKECKASSHASGQCPNGFTRKMQCVEPPPSSCA
jgi:hypothetical protein